jgi:hypothetical protein
MKEEIFTLSFCIACRNNLYQLQKTLRKNIDDNILHQNLIEFVLLDFDSKDGTCEWVTKNFQKELKTGYLKFYLTKELTHWNTSIARNTAHICATNDIAVNLDCDNYTGVWGGVHVIRMFRQYGENILFHQFNGKMNDGSYSRISVFNKYFKLLGGYDESFESVGYQDQDLILRFIQYGLEYISDVDNQNDQSILYTNEKKVINIDYGKNYTEMLSNNFTKSKFHLSEGKLIVNNGLIGIQKNIIDFRGNSFCPQIKMSTCRFVTKTDNYLSKIIEKLLHVAPFIKKDGLLNGKMGIVILLYYYSRYKNDSVSNNYADILLDEIVQNISIDLESDFGDGLLGIAWGINHLASACFIEKEDDTFYNIDASIWKDDILTVNLDSFEKRSYLGLYILSRMNMCSSGEMPIWKQRLIDYLQTMYTILILRYTSYSFPALSCSGLCSLIFVCTFLQDSKEFKPYISSIYAELSLIIRISYINENNNSGKYILKQLLSKTSLSIIDDSFMNFWSFATLMDINQFYLNRFLLGIRINTPDIIHRAVGDIICDEKRINELLSFLNPGNAGLGNYVGGLCWSFLQWCINNENEKISDNPAENFNHFSSQILYNF